MLGRHARLIASHQQEAFGGRRFRLHCLHTDANRTCQSFFPIFVCNDLRLSKIDRVPDQFAMRAEHHEDRRRTGLRHASNRALKQGFAANHDQLFRLAEPAARTCGDNDGSDRHRHQSTLLCLTPTQATGKTSSTSKANLRRKADWVGNQRSAMAEVYPQSGAKENYGLRTGVLGPFETLAQSVSAMAPSTSPSLTLTLAFAIAGNATWLVYLMATGATLLIGFCVSRFARLSASPGSLYTYTAETLPPVFGVAAALGLVVALPAQP